MIEEGFKFTSNKGVVCFVKEYINAKKVKVFFEDTGHEEYYRAEKLRLGQFIDRSTYNLEGNIYESKNYGDFIVVKDITHSNKLIKFLQTGYTREALSSNIQSGEVKDSTKPIVSGIGYIGDGIFSTASKGYSRWISMIKRCYEVIPDGSNKTYLLKGTKVCDEWLNFQNFNAWFEGYLTEHNIDYTGKLWNLDKDILGNGLLYSPDTCCIIPYQLNQLYKDLEHANGVAANKNKSKPYCCKVGGVWVGDFKTKAECQYTYGICKLNRLKEIYSEYEDKIPYNIIEKCSNYIHNKYLRSHLEVEDN